MVEALKTFERRERRYPLPTNGTPEEVVKAALKSWRNPERFKLSIGGDDATSGRTLPAVTCFALDVRRLADDLEAPYRQIVALYYMTPRSTYPRDHGEHACGGQCHEHYGNPQIARAFGWVDARGRPETRKVGQFKRQAVSRIAVTLFPEYYRGRKSRRGI